MTQGVNAAAPPDQWKGATVEPMEPVMPMNPADRSLPQKFLHASIGDTPIIAPGQKL